MYTRHRHSSPQKKLEIKHVALLVFVTFVLGFALGQVVRLSISRIALRSPHTYLQSTHPWSGAIVLDFSRAQLSLIRGA